MHKCPAPGTENLNKCPGVARGGWAQVELTDALRLFGYGNIPMWTRSLFGLTLIRHPVVRIVYKVLPELWRYFQNQISWPTLPEWRNLMGNWEEFPNVVGAIDTTPHEIYRPLIEPQRPFYSGYRHYHCINTQLVMDNEGHIRFV